MIKFVKLILIIIYISSTGFVFTEGIDKKYNLLSSVQKNLNDEYIDKELNIAEEDPSNKELTKSYEQWTDKIFSLGLFPSLNIYPYPYPGVELYSRIWMGNRGIISFQVNYYPSPYIISLVSDISLWSSHGKFGWYIGGGGGYQFLYFGSSPVINVTAGLEWLVSEQYSLGAKVNAGYKFYSYYYNDNYYIDFVINASLVFPRPVKSPVPENNLADSTLYPPNSMNLDSWINTGRINLLIQKNLHKNIEKIQEEAKTLPMEDRMVIFDHFKKDFGAPLLVNGILGFGIGSLIQGDKAAGIFAMTLDVAATTMFILLGVPEVVPFKWKTVSLTGGLILGVGSRLFQIIEPIVFANAYNKKLEKSLLISLEFHPRIHLAMQDSSFGGAVTARF